MDRSSILLATGSVAACSLLLYTFMSSKPATSTSLVRFSEGGDGGDYITPGMISKIFDQLFVQMQGVLASLSQQIAQLQATGQRLPEDQLRQVLTAEFERALLVKQQAVFDGFDVDEDCVKEATNAYLEREDEYPNVKRSVERFQKLYETVSGNDSSNKPTSGASVKDLSQGKLVEAAEIYFDALTAAMGLIVKSFKDKGMDLNDPNVTQQMHIQFGAVANDAGEQALKGIGVDIDVFKKSIEKHSQNPDVGRALAMLQMKQQQDLMAMGVAPM